MNLCFSPADILLPRDGIPMHTWSVIACDQYTADPAYWQELQKAVKDAPSTLHLILPEIYLGAGDTPQRIAKINSTMRRYEAQLFKTLANAFIFVQRTQPDGRVRCGLVGKLDLECYDYHEQARPLVRATEGTVLSRIPPRMKIREHASLELPHIMLLADDPDDTLLSPVKAQTTQMEILYDFPLLMGGGSIRGWLCAPQQSAELCARLAAMQNAVRQGSFLFAVGDGNHSLATAKACYEALKERIGAEAAAKHPARYALCEVVNLYDSALDFEPIYRAVFHVNPEHLLQAFCAACPPKCGGNRYTVCTKAGERELLCGDGGRLPVAVLQEFLDGYLRQYGGEVDYIHGAEQTRALACAEDTVCFLFSGMEKTELFPAVRAGGALPRKTFSMGHADDKRFYLECRKIL